MSFVTRLLNLADALERLGCYRHVDALTNVVSRTVSAQYAGPQNLNLPLDTRVIPFSEMETEYEDAAKKRREYHPRLIQKEHEQQSLEDLEDVFGNGTGDGDHGASIFSLNGPSASGITQRMYDPKSAGYMGIEQFEWDHRDENYKGYPTYSPN